MPLYEYECFICGFRFEKIQKVSAEPLKICPECGGSVRRLMGVPALQFKGSGWYVTDYGKGNGAVAAASRTAEHQATSSGSDTSSDSSSSNTPSKESSDGSDSGVSKAS